MVKFRNKIGILTILIILILCVSNSVIAATTTLTATPTSSTVKSGETFSVTVKSSIKLTGWTIALTSDGGCTFSSASGGEVTGTSVFGSDLNGKTNLATYKFKAPTVDKDTKYTITFSGTAMCDENTDDVNSTSCKATITVKAPTTTSTPNDNTTTETPKEKSKDANLSTLGVTPKEYDFSGFSKNKTSYSVTVPYDVDSLKVLYKTADSNAKVKVSGNTGFEVGSNNKITIKVTAEAGNSKTYTIKVTKLAEEEEKPGNLIDEEKDIYLTSLEIEGLELSPAFEKDIYSYTATLSDSSITELKINAVANDEKAKIEVSGNTELVEGENTVNILVTTDESDSQKVYQVVVNKEAASVTTDASEEPTNSTTDLVGMLKKYAIIAVSVIVLIIIAIIVLIILIRKENKKLNNEKDDNEEEIEESNMQEYNVYKNDENEFVNNDFEKDNFIESLYKQRNGDIYEDLTEEEKETIQEISNQTAEIFEEKVEGQSVEYQQDKTYEENPLELRRKRRSKGKHSL